MTGEHPEALSKCYKDHQLTEQYSHKITGLERNSQEFKQTILLEATSYYVQALRNKYK